MAPETLENWQIVAILLAMTFNLNPNGLLDKFVIPKILVRIYQI